MMGEMAECGGLAAPVGTAGCTAGKGPDFESPRGEIPQRIAAPSNGAGVAGIEAAGVAIRRGDAELAGGALADHRRGRIAQLLPGGRAGGGLLRRGNRNQGILARRKGEIAAGKDYGGPVPGPSR